MHKQCGNKQLTTLNMNSEQNNNVAFKFKKKEDAVQACPR